MGEDEKGRICSSVANTPLAFDIFHKGIMQRLADMQIPKLVSIQKTQDNNKKRGCPNIWDILFTQLNSMGLCHRNVFVNIFASDQCIVKHIKNCNHNHPETRQVTLSHIGNHTLNQRQDTSTTNHHHK